MKPRSSFFSVIALALLGVAAFSQARADDAAALTATDYGKLYLIEHRTQSVAQWQLGADFGQIVNNAYLDIPMTSLTAGYNFGRYLNAGAIFSKYFARESTVTDAIQQSLKTNGISQALEKPDYSLFATFSAVPLSGQLNLFSVSSLPFEIALTTGAGLTSYVASATRATVLFAAAPQLMVSRIVGVRFTVSDELESIFSSDSLSRLSGRFGAFVRF